MACCLFSCPRHLAWNSGPSSNKCFSCWSSMTWIAINRPLLRQNNQMMEIILDVTASFSVMKSFWMSLLNSLLWVGNLISDVSDIKEKQDCLQLSLHCLQSRKSDEKHQRGFLPSPETSSLAALELYDRFNTWEKEAHCCLVHNGFFYRAIFSKWLGRKCWLTSLLQRW